MEWRNIYRGLIMGASDVIPGVSGGTIAVLLGIYDRLIAAINGLFSKHWKQYLSFLIPLAIGVATAIFTLARLMKWLLANYPQPTYFFFLGLVIGIIPNLLITVQAKRTFTIKHIILLMFGALLVSLMIFGMGADQGTVITNKTVKTYILLFFAGILASAAMILPGISGSVVFLVIGVYPTIIDAISTIDVITIGVVGIGIVTGIVMMSKIIHFFLRRYQTATFALIIGAVIGSIVVIFPGWPTDPAALILNVGTFASGLLGAYILGKIEHYA